MNTDLLRSINNELASSLNGRKERPVRGFSDSKKKTEKNSLSEFVRRSRSQGVVARTVCFPQVKNVISAQSRHFFSFDFIEEWSLKDEPALPTHEVPTDRRDDLIFDFAIDPGLHKPDVAHLLDNKPLFFTFKVSSSLAKKFFNVLQVAEKQSTAPGCLEMVRVQNDAAKILEAALVDALAFVSHVLSCYEVANDKLVIADKDGFVGAFRKVLEEELPGINSQSLNEVFDDLCQELRSGFNNLAVIDDAWISKSGDELLVEYRPCYNLPIIDEGMPVRTG